MAAEGLGLFQNAPTPDWKDGRKPVPTKGRNGAGRAPRNPGKRVSNLRQVLGLNLLQGRELFVYQLGGYLWVGLAF